MIPNNTPAKSCCHTPQKNEDKIREFQPLIIALSLVVLWTIFRTAETQMLHLHAILQNFMAGFFLIFGTLKILGWAGFVETFRRYDPLGQISVTYAYIYPLLEFLLGLSFLFNTLLVPANLITIFILSVNALGVWKVIRDKQQIKCACLGGWFQLPISWITLVEDLIMVIMAATMLFIK
jgi:hypothetical protein